MINPVRILSCAALFLIIGIVCFGCIHPTKRPYNKLSFDRIEVSVYAISHEGEDNQWDKVCGLLNRYGRVACDEIVKKNCRQIGAVRVCDYERIPLEFAPPLGLDRLKDLNSDLLNLENDGVPLGVEFASLDVRYHGLATEATISISVRISVSPGARLFLERRWLGVCEEVETSRNVFHDEITLRKGQEWVFYRTEMETGHDMLRRYFRLNVLTKDVEELRQEQFDHLIKRP